MSLHARASACWRRLKTQGSRPTCSLLMGREGRQVGRGTIWVGLGALLGRLWEPREVCSFWGGPLSLALLRPLEALIWALGSGPVGLDPVLSPSSKAGASSPGPSSLEGTRWVKALEAFGAPGPARLNDCRGPSQSLVGSFGVALPLVWVSPSPLRGPDAESSPF